MFDPGDIYTGNVFDKPYHQIPWWTLYGDYVIIASVIVAIGVAVLIWYLARRTKADHSIPRKVTFYGYKEKEYKYGSLLNPDIPVKEGYTFCGWYKDTSFLEPCKSTFKVKRDIILYPKWEKER